MGQPEFDGGPWWVRNAAGVVVGALYVFAGTEIWFLVKDTNDNGGFATWPGTANAELDFVRMKEADGKTDRAMGTATNPSTPTPQNPAITYERKKHVVSALSDVTA